MAAVVYDAAYDALLQRRLDRHTHRSARVGEVQALGKASKQAPALWRRIVDAIGASGVDGLTPDEFVATCALPGETLLINTVRRRFTDLWKGGQIRHHIEGLHRANAAGNLCEAWQLGADPHGSASARKPRPSPLSLEQIRLLEAPFSLEIFAPRGFDSIVDFVRAIEAAHGIGSPR